MVTEIYYYIHLVDALLAHATHETGTRVHTPHGDWEEGPHQEPNEKNPLGLSTWAESWTDWSVSRHRIL